MLVENILNIFSMIMDPIIDAIPAAGSFEIPEYIFGVLLSFFRAVGTLLPVTQLLPLFLFVVGLYMYKFFSGIIFRIRSIF